MATTIQHERQASVQVMPGTRDGRKSRTFGTQTRQSGSARTVRTPVSAREKGVQVGTYPEVSEKARLVKAQKEMFPNIRKANREHYLFIRGKRETLRRIKNAMVLEFRGVENYGGTILGVSEDVVGYEGDRYGGPEEYVFVILFKDKDKAIQWTEHSRKFKQKDFPDPPDAVEMFLLPAHYIPQDKDLCAFQLTIMHGIRNYGEFEDRYVKRVAPLMDKRRIYHGMVASNDHVILRGCGVPRGAFIVMNCSNSIDTLKQFYNSDEYADAKEYRQCTVPVNDTCFFTLQPYNS